MKGHIRQRSPGHFAIVLDVRDPTTGKRKRRWHTFAGTKRQAQIECARLISEITNGTALEPSKVTVREYLERWLAHIATQISPRSCECYRENVETWIVPALGNVKLAKLQPEQIAKAYSDALAHGGRNGRGLSPRSVRLMHGTLSQALKQAVTWNLLGKNPAASCKPPRVERKQMKVLDMDSTASLIELAKGGRLHMPVLLFALSGARRGRLRQFAGTDSISTPAGSRLRPVSNRPPWGHARNRRSPAGRAQSPSPPSSSRSCAGTGSGKPRSCYALAFGRPMKPTFAFVRMPVHGSLECLPLRSPG
jgi:hypothetical protein